MSAITLDQLLALNDEIAALVRRQIEESQVDMLWLGASGFMGLSQGNEG